MKNENRPTLVDQIEASIATFDLTPILEVLEKFEQENVKTSSDTTTFVLFLYQTIWTVLSGLSFTADALGLVKTTIYQLRRYNNKGGRGQKAQSNCPKQVSRLFDTLSKALTLELNLKHFEPLRIEIRGDDFLCAKGLNGLELLRKKITSLDPVKILQRELASYIRDSDEKQELLAALVQLASEFGIVSIVDNAKLDDEIALKIAV